MNRELSESNAFETSRLELLEKPPDLLADLVTERFDDDFPSGGLYAGKLPDRVREFVRNHVRGVCDRASQLGQEVWQAIHDDHTAHNVERFALVCGFFASEVLKVGHWPTHEVAALVLLILATRPKG